MKKTFLVVLFLTFLITSTAIAHSPKNLVAQFDLENHILSVEVNHIVGGVSTSHYIIELTVSHNGKEVIIQQTAKQLDDTQTFFYFMPAVEVGDEIEVLAVCNLSGQKNIKIIVEDKG